MWHNNNRNLFLAVLKARSLTFEDIKVEFGGSLLERKFFFYILTSQKGEDKIHTSLIRALVHS